MAPKQIKREITTSIISSIIVVFVAAVISAPFFVGIYREKIDHISNQVENNSRNIDHLTKVVYVLLGVTQKDYTGINVKAYINTSLQKGLSLESIVKGLSTLKNASPETRKAYLMKHQGFNENEVSVIFSPTDSSGNAHQRKMPHQ